MVWVIAFGELFFGDLWCVVWGYGGMRTHFSLLNPLLGCLFRGVPQRLMMFKAMRGKVPRRVINGRSGQFSVISARWKRSWSGGVSQN